MPASVTARLGADFHKLWGASAVSNLGDGFGAVAAPLLATTLTGLWVAFSFGFMLVRAVLLVHRAHGDAWLVTGATRPARP